MRKLCRQILHVLRFTLIWPSNDSLSTVITNLLHAFLIDNDLIKLGIFPLVLLHALDCRDKATFATLLLSLANASTRPIAPARQCVVYDLVAFVVDRFTLFFIEIFEYIVSCEHHLYHFFVPTQRLLHFEAWARTSIVRTGTACFIYHHDRSTLPLFRCFMLRLLVRLLSPRLSTYRIPVFDTASLETRRAFYPWISRGLGFRRYRALLCLRWWS